MKVPVGIPLLLSAVSFILTLLALFAGHKKGFMEDYHVVMFNTSTLGQNFLQHLVDGDDSSASATATTAASATITSAAATATDTGGLFDGWGDKFSSLEASATALVGSVESDAASILNDVGNDIADKLADELGIEQFYSVHVMDLCYGEYAPNTTAKGSWANITECSKPLNFSAMDVSQLLNQQLSLGRFNISLSDLGVTSDIDDKLKDLPKIFEALAVIYILSAVFTGLASLAALASFFLLKSPHSHHTPSQTKRATLVPLVNLLVLALPAVLLLLVGSLLYTIGAAEVVKKIHDLGADDIGLKVEVGGKFEALSWAAFALMALALGYWVWEVVTACVSRRREKKMRNRGEKVSLESYRR